MKVPYRCLYNHELFIVAVSQTPYASYREPVTDAQTIGMVKELAGTGVDALMLCPQAWMTNLWRSEIDRRWQDTAPFESEPLLESDLKYWTKAYIRIRRYLLAGADPVGLSLQTARECGIAPFLSYRMNEHHYTNNPEALTHSRFWKEHPQFMLSQSGSMLNYLEEEVRDYYFALICELLETYEVEGFECDFMRYPRYFPTDRVEEGLEVMTAFVRKIRAKLDEVGARRSRRLALSVRVPRSLTLAREIGLDVARWDDEGLIDMVNMSSFFRTSPEVEIEDFRDRLANVSLFGELHFVSHSGEAPGGYQTGIHRLTLPQLYKSTALAYLERGADGISLFNFAYTRDHSFNEPRRNMFPGIEPPFEVIADLVSIDRLRASSQLIAITPDFGSLPRQLDAFQSTTFRVYVGKCFDQPFVGALLRIESDKVISHRPMEATVNGQPTSRRLFSGELFPPISLEALPDPLKLAHFAFDPSGLQPGWNEIEIENRWLTSTGGGIPGRITLVRLEIALYRTASDEFKNGVLHLGK